MLTINAAAIRTTTGQVFSVPKPGRHGDVFRMLQKSGASWHGATQGFLTSEGNFVTRAEAAVIAFSAGQLPHDQTIPETVFSEDLW